MLWKNDEDEKIGVWKKIREDERGIYVEGRIEKGVEREREELEIMS